MDDLDKLLEDIFTDDYQYPELLAQSPPAARSQLMEIKKCLDYYGLSFNDLDNRELLLATMTYPHCVFLDEASGEVLRLLGYDENEGGIDERELPTTGSAGLEAGSS